MKRFKEKVAIITGGAQGIGEATTRRLANEGDMTAILVMI
jgi:NAD(P)-dependent dehydrogenase (short-subunit alcohol dehydrogenase family)